MSDRNLKEFPFLSFGGGIDEISVPHLLRKDRAQVIANAETLAAGKLSVRKTATEWDEELSTFLFTTKSWIVTKIFVWYPWYVPENGNDKKVILVYTSDYELHLVYELSSGYTSEEISITGITYTSESDLDFAVFSDRLCITDGVNYPHFVKIDDEGDIISGLLYLEQPISMPSMQAFDTYLPERFQENLNSQTYIGPCGLYKVCYTWKNKYNDRSNPSPWSMTYDAQLFKLDPDTVDDVRYLLMIVVGNVKLPPNMDKDALDLAEEFEFYIKYSRFGEGLVYTSEYIFTESKKITAKYDDSDVPVANSYSLYIPVSEDGTPVSLDNNRAPIAKRAIEIGGRRILGNLLVRPQSLFKFDRQIKLGLDNIDVKNICDGVVEILLDYNKESPLRPDFYYLMLNKDKMRLFHADKTTPVPVVVYDYTDASGGGSGAAQFITNPYFTDLPLGTGWVAGTSWTFPGTGAIQGSESTASDLSQVALASGNDYKVVYFYQYFANTTIQAFCGSVAGALKTYSTSGYDLVNEIITANGNTFKITARNVKLVYVLVFDRGIAGGTTYNKIRLFASVRDINPAGITNLYFMYCTGQSLLEGVDSTWDYDAVNGEGAEYGEFIEYEAATDWLGQKVYNVLRADEYDTVSNPFNDLKDALFGTGKIYNKVDTNRNGVYSDDDVQVVQNTATKLIPDVSSNIGDGVGSIETDEYVYAETIEDTLPNQGHMMLVFKTTEAWDVTVGGLLNNIMGTNHNSNEMNTVLYDADAGNVVLYTNNGAYTANSFDRLALSINVNYCLVFSWNHEKTTSVDEEDVSMFLVDMDNGTMVAQKKTLSDKMVFTDLQNIRIGKNDFAGVPGSKSMLVHKFKTVFNQYLDAENVSHCNMVRNWVNYKPMFQDTIGLKYYGDNVIDDPTFQEDVSAGGTGTYWDLNGTSQLRITGGQLLGNVATGYATEVNDNATSTRALFKIKLSSVTAGYVKVKNGTALSDELDADGTFVADLTGTNNYISLYFNGFVGAVDFVYFYPPVENNRIEIGDAEEIIVEQRPNRIMYASNIYGIGFNNRNYYDVKEDILDLFAEPSQLKQEHLEILLLMTRNEMVEKPIKGSPAEWQRGTNDLVARRKNMSVLAPGTIARYGDKYLYKAETGTMMMGAGAIVDIEALEAGSKEKRIHIPNKTTYIGFIVPIRDQYWIHDDEFIAETSLTETRFDNVENEIVLSSGTWEALGVEENMIISFNRTTSGYNDRDYIVKSISGDTLKTIVNVSYDEVTDCRLKCTKTWVYNIKQDSWNIFYGLDIKQSQTLDGGDDVADVNIFLTTGEDAINKYPSDIDSKYNLLITKREYIEKGVVKKLKINSPDSPTTYLRAFDPNYTNDMQMTLVQTRDKEIVSIPPGNTRAEKFDILVANFTEISLIVAKAKIKGV